MLGEFLIDRSKEGYIIDYTYHPMERVLETVISKDSHKVRHLLDNTYLYDEERFVEKLSEMVKELDNELGI